MYIDVCVTCLIVWKILEVLLFQLPSCLNLLCVFQDPVALASSFETWWELQGEKFFKVKSEEQDVEVADADDLEFEELDFDVGEVVEVEDAEFQDDEEALDHEKVQTIEDRSKILAELETMEKECKNSHAASLDADGNDGTSESDANVKPQEQREDAEEVPEQAVGSNGLNLGPILDGFRGQDVFNFSKPDSRGQKACLDRMAAMKPQLTEFVKLAKVEEGLLSKTQIAGKENCKANTSEWNQMMSELARAKQYAKFRGLRNSRMANWMQAQDDLKFAAFEKGKVSEEEWDEGLLRVDVFRPASAKALQYVIYKSEGDMVEYHIGIITSIYRGSVSKAKGTSRRLTITKPLPAPAPAALVARVRVLQMSKLEKDNVMTASGISKQSIISVENVCGEIGLEEAGIRSGVIYATFNEMSMKIWEELSKGDLIFGKDDRKSKRRKKADADSEFQGFTLKSFPKSDAGDASIEKLAALFGFFLLEIA